MPCALTQGYALDCRKSYGGIKQVWFLELENATLTEASGIVTAISLVATKFWKKYELTLETADGNATGTHSREMGTSTYAHTLSFPINKLTTSVRNELLILAQNRLLVVFEDNNGNKWLLGKENGLMLESDAHKTGVKYGDRSGIELSFSGVEKAPQVEVTATIVTS
jgi:hypothetical protein